MKQLATILCFVQFLLFLIPEARSQKSSLPDNQFTNELVREGFGNVGVIQKGSRVTIFYENLRYRWEVDGLSKVMGMATTFFNDSLLLRVVPMHHTVPIVSIEAGVRSFGQIAQQPLGSTGRNPGFRAVLNTDSLQSLLRKTRLKNKTFGKVDLIFLPGLRVQFGNYDNPIEWQFSISPILQTSLWRGSLLTAQVLVPLHNELQQNAESKVRLETATLNQLWRLPKNLFVTAAAGVFAFSNKISSPEIYQRYGISGDIRKYFYKARFCAGLTASYTGMMNISGGYLNYYSDTKMTYSLFGEYREPRFDLTTRLTAGKFLYDDYAVRLELSRQFHECNLSFFVIKSTLKTEGETGIVGGFGLIIPIAPRKALRPGPLRVGLANYFHWEFRERTVDPLATTIRTNNDWSDTFRNLHPDFVGQ